jgi:hypothetical protein
MVKSKAEVVAATKQEIKSTWRVYVREWLVEFRDCSEETVQDYFNERFKGRVTEDDWSIAEDSEDFSYVLRLRLYNVKAEWKEEAEAREHERLLQATMPELEAEAVPRNSRREHVLKSYGKLMLKVD